MSDKQLLKEFLESQFEENNEKLDFFLDSKKENYCIELREKLRKIIENLDELIDFDLEELKVNFPQIWEKDIKFLEFYKKTQIAKFIKISETDIGFLRQIFARINIMIEEYLELFEEKSKQYNSKNRLLEDLILRIEKGKIEINDIDIVYNLLENVDIDEAIKLSRAISNLGIENKLLFLENDGKEEDIFSNETNLNIDDIIEVFSKYNIDYNKFSEVAKKEIQKYGVLYTIEEILNEFEINNMPLSNYIDEISIKGKTLGLARILFASDPKNVRKIFEICKSNNIVDRDIDGKVILNNEQMPSVDIVSLLMFPSLFISRRKKWSKKKNEGSNFINYDSNTGRYEDFVENIELFNKLGLDIEKSFEKCGHIYVLPNLQIKTAIKNLELYGINLYDYMQTLSCLKSINQCSLLDQAIELGIFEYMKENPSYLGIKTSESPMFYKIARLKQLGMPIPISNRGLPSEISYDNKDLIITTSINNVEIINQNNGMKITNKYIPEFSKKNDYDQAIMESFNNTINISKNTEIIKLLDDRFIGVYYDKYKSFEIKKVLSSEIDFDTSNTLLVKKQEQESLIYIIGGIKISRLKVLRIYDTLLANNLGNDLNSIMYAITKNSIITKTEYDTIYNEISSLFIKKNNVIKRSLT